VSGGAEVGDTRAAMCLSLAARTCGRQRSSSAGTCWRRPIWTPAARTAAVTWASPRPPPTWSRRLLRLPSPPPLNSKKSRNGGNWRAKGTRRKCRGSCSLVLRGADGGAGGPAGGGLAGPTAARPRPDQPGRRRPRRGPARRLPRAPR